MSKASRSTRGTGSTGSGSPRSSTFDDISPIDETVIARVHAGGAKQVDAAVTAARNAFPAWAGLPRSERAEILRAVAAGVDERAEDLARVETRDNGSLLRSHRRGVMPRVGNNFRFFADYLDSLDHPDGDIRGHRERVTYDPRASRRSSRRGTLR